MSGAEHVGAGGWRRRWLFVGGGSGAVLVAGVAALWVAVGPRGGLTWAGVAGPLLLYEAWFFASRRAKRGGPATSIRPPNAVTMVRGWLYAIAGGFVALPPTALLAWVPGLCYGLGALLDQVDGRVARRTGAESRLGEQLDMAFDTLGFLIAPSVAVAWGRLPAWYLLLPAAQYLFRLGREARRRRGRPVTELSPNELRRALSGLQMGFLSVALLPIVPPGPLAVVAAAVLAPSLAMFARDWLVVAGHYQPGDEG